MGRVDNRSLHLLSSLQKPLSRRAFVEAGSTLAVFGAFPRLRTASPGLRILSPRAATAFGPPDTDLMHAVALRAIDAAKSAGATYADARLVRSIKQATVSRTNRLIGYDWSARIFNRRSDVPQSVETETHGLAVRALVNGAWGFAASPWWTLEEAAILARDAVAQARDNAQWTSVRVDLAPAPVTKGEWTTPLRIDPFSIPIQEKMAVVENALDAYRGSYRLLDRELDASLLGIACQHTTRVVATSEGSLFTQHFYDTRFMQRNGNAGRTGMTKQGDHWVWDGGWGQKTVVDDLVPYGTGWETVIDADLWTLGKQAADEAYAKFSSQPAKPVEVGQYTVVLDAEMMAKVLDVTVARATDFDRMVGNEVNAGGTTYIGSDPLQLLGNYSFGTPLLNVSTTRAATVGAVKGLPATQWDDEGVPSAPFTLVKDGVLQDVATTRETAARLAPYYQKKGRPVASHGCAMSDSAFDLTTVGPPTVVMEPGPQDVTFDAMISSVPKGLTIRVGVDGAVNSDFQLRQLTITGDMQEIVNGRLGRPVAGGAVVIDATQLWKNLMVIGGQGTERGFENVGMWEKGEPAKTLATAAVAVPATFSAMPVVDVSRRR